MASNVQPPGASSVPNPTMVPLTGENGLISPQWYELLVSLFYRTGGGQGQALSTSPTANGQVFKAGDPPNVGWGFIDGSSFGAENANAILAGPVAGGPATAAFRAMVSADMAAVDGQYPGTTDGSVAGAGNIGEVISSSVASGAAIGLANGTPTDITSINLGIGDWDIWGSIGLTAASTTAKAWINQASATDPTAPNSGAYLSLGAQAVPVFYPLGMMNLLLLAPATLYLSANLTSGGAQNGYGFIGARRRR